MKTDFSKVLPKIFNFHISLKMKKIEMIFNLLICIDRKSIAKDPGSIMFG